MNASDMLELVRDNLNEATASHWSDVNLVRRLNQSQRKVARLVASSPGQWLVKSLAVTPVASVITLPSDCARPLYLEESSSGMVVEWLSSGVSFRRVSREVGTSLYTGSLEAYPLMSTLEVNQSSYTTACTLWYQIRVPDLHTGTESSVAASSLGFAADRNRSFVDDYYNGVTVEVISNSTSIVSIRSEITDYVASTGKATITGTPADSDTYGTISRLPQETHDLIVLEATRLALMKPSSTIDEKVMQMFNAELKDTRRDVEGWLMSRIPESDGVAIGDMY